jgi:hypothetical protein
VEDERGEDGGVEMRWEMKYERKMDEVWKQISTLSTTSTLSYSGKLE